MINFCAVKTMTQRDQETHTQAFIETDYYIQIDTQHARDWHKVNIGKPCAVPTRRWLQKRCQGQSAWIITAYNPRAMRADGQLNSARDAALRACLDASGHRYAATDSRAQAADWPAEPGVCILDMDEGLARALALRFEQAAIVAVPIEKEVQLVWIN